MVTLHLLVITVRMCHCVGVQNLEKNYRDFQFRVTHLDPIIEPESYQREKSRVTAQMQKEPMSSLGNCLCC